MQQDQKVGLALGVLLIGTVAAFFFRNEPPTPAGVARLERAEEVDREISEKRLTPYLAPIETDEPARGTRARAASDTRDDNDARTGERKLPRWEDLQAERDDPFAEDGPQKSVPAPAPDPIRFEAVTTDAHAGPKPDRNQAWNPTDDLLTAAEPPAQPKIHEVQRGETLSSIAGKYLGSQAKFHEIFEANRDQLRDANDLQVGMKLRIPDPKAKPVPTKTTAQPTSNRTQKAERKPDAPKVPEPPAKERDIDADIEDVFAQSAVQPQDEMKPAAEDEPKSVPAAPEPPKVKFSPSKRRPVR